MRIASNFMVAIATLLAACATTADRTTVEKQVADTERAFAKTMADRDLAAFSRFLADETVSFPGRRRCAARQR